MKREYHYTHWAGRYFTYKSGWYRGQVIEVVSNEYIGGIEYISCRMWSCGEPSGISRYNTTAKRPHEFKEEVEDVLEEGHLTEMSKDEFIILTLN
jgi:hypothetical protein